MRSFCLASAPGMLRVLLPAFGDMRQEVMHSRVRRYERTIP